jgi:cytochrome c oxidase assembly protein Cox11
MYASIFALCYAMVPVYRIFCEHMGLEGDLKQKDYSILDKKGNLTPNLSKFSYKVIKLLNL